MKLRPYTVDKPWGFEIVFADTELYIGKKMHVKAGEELSLQWHDPKDESMFLDSGIAEITDGEVFHRVTPWEAFRFPPQTVHSVKAITDVIITEVSTPHKEVFRIKDKYGREKQEE